MQRGTHASTHSNHTIMPTKSSLLKFLTKYYAYPPKNHIVLLPEKFGKKQKNLENITLGSNYIKICFSMFHSSCTAVRWTNEGTLKKKPQNCHFLYENANIYMIMIINSPQHRRRKQGWKEKGQHYLNDFFSFRFTITQQKRLVFEKKEGMLFFMLFSYLYYPSFTFTA